VEKFYFDNEDIDELLGLSSSLLYNYKQLQKLEYEDKKDSKEYKRYVKRLSSTKLLEDAIYDRLLKEGKVYRILNALSYGPEAYDLQMIIDETTEFDDKKLIKRRVTNRLAFMLTQFNNNEKELQNAFRSTFGDELINKTIGMNAINNAILKDFINALLAILNQHICVNQGEYFDIFTKLKYSISFIYKFVEDDFLENDFNISSVLYITNLAVAKAHNIHMDYVIECTRDTMAPIIDSELIDKLARKIEGNARPQRGEFFDMIISQIIVRAALIFYNNEWVEGLKEEFEKSVQDLNVTIDNNTIMKIIMDIFEHNKKDQELPIVINIRKRGKNE